MAEALLARMSSGTIDAAKGPGGKQILLQDPSGNVVELFQPASR
jgi:hypothetical protein